MVETDIGPKRGRSPGRPSKLTQDVKDKLVNALIATCTEREACIYADIAERTFETWKAKARADIEAGRESEYTHFMQDIARAREMAKPRLTMLLSKAAERDPRITLAILERRYPKEWGVRQTIETRDRTGEPDEIDLSKLPDEELLKRAKQIIEDQSKSA